MPFQIRDRTERTRMEQAVRQREKRFRAIVEQTTAGIAQVDLQGYFLLVNQRFSDIVGYSAEELYGRRQQDITHPEDQAKNLELFKQNVAAETGYSIEKRYIRKDGKAIWVHNAVSLVRDRAGKPHSVVAVVFEITDYKRVEERLQEAGRRKDEFLAMLAHELRNPLAPIRNALHLIRSTDPERRGEIAQAYEIIERQVENMARLVDDLLDVSRINSGKIQLRKERVDVATVVARAIEGSRPLLEARRHLLSTVLPQEPVIVEADPVRLAQVLWNLLNNAAKYTPERGRIELSVEAGADIAIRVRDNGMGISPEMLPKVFDMFTQMERTLNRSEGGLGIGLNLVRQITELHGGSVRALSQGPGQGCEFLVRLPLPPPDLTGPEMAAKPSGGPQARPVVSGQRILVVDDNRDSADTLAMLLRLFGNDVRTAYDGGLALAAAAAYRPQVVLLDIGLPGLDGLEVCRRLRASPDLKDAFIVAMTGYGQEDDRRRSEKAGFNAHLVKPVDFEALKQLLSGKEPADPA